MVTRGGKKYHMEKFKHEDHLEGHTTQWHYRHTYGPHL